MNVMKLAAQLLIIGIAVLLLVRKLQAEINQGIKDSLHPLTRK